MGLFRRVRDIFDRNDDDEKKKEEEQPQESGGQQAATEVPSTSAGTTVEAPATPEPAVTEPSPTAPSSEPVVSTTETVVAAAAETTEGTVSGAGLDRTYTTKAGDTLEVIAAYFYGTEVQRQRLLDDNPDLNLEQYGGSLPGGIRIRVSEDVARGDTIGGAPSA